MAKLITTFGKLHHTISKRKETNVNHLLPHNKIEKKPTPDSGVRLVSLPRSAIGNVRVWINKNKFGLTDVFNTIELNDLEYSDEYSIFHSEEFSQSRKGKVIKKLITDYQKSKNHYGARVFVLLMELIEPTNTYKHGWIYIIESSPMTIYAVPKSDGIYICNVHYDILFSVDMNVDNLKKIIE